MLVGNLNQFEEALVSRNPWQLYEAWSFLERVERKTKDGSAIFQQKLLEKKLRILRAALEICLPEGKIVFFGNRNKISETITQHQKELSDASPTNA